MSDTIPQVSTDTALRRLTEPAKARWGDDYAEQHRQLLQQAAEHIASIANNLPGTETEPAFFHSPNR